MTAKSRPAIKPKPPHNVIALDRYRAARPVEKQIRRLEAIRPLDERANVVPIADPIRMQIMECNASLERLAILRQEMAREGYGNGAK
jgi:hypothetical protein